MMTTKKYKSPYTAAITGGGFLLQETIALLPLLQSPRRKVSLADEKLNNNILQINSETSRSKVIGEISRRYDALPSNFWEDFLQMSEAEQTVANLFVILKTYKILFDLHVNVTMRRWRCGSKSLTIEDILIEFGEISSHDEFVDSWTDKTKLKVSSAYLTILRKAGMLRADDKLSSIKAAGLDYYLTHGEPWFLDACLLAPYEIENIKRSLL